MTKKCNGECQQEKDISEFSKDKFSKDGYLFRCKECNKKYFRKYYQNNIQNYKEYEQKQSDFKKIRLKEFLSHYQCVDCGNKDVRVLEFDHIYGKDEEIIELAFGKWEDFLEEFKKCEIRCRNHHRRRHLINLNSYRWRWLKGELKLSEVTIHKEGIKICTKCKISKPYSEFGISKWEKDGYNNHCRECDSKNQRIYYQKVREKEVITNLSYKPRQKLRDFNGSLTNKKIFICEYLSTHPCNKCGEKDILMLEFHHVRGKEFEITSLDNHTLEEIHEEIGKCEIKCCNCHKIMTFYN